MAPWTHALLQAGGEDSTALAVAIVAILIGVAYLVARAGIDRLRGTYTGRATYQLSLEADGTLTLVDDEEKGPAVTELNPDAMLALVEAVEARNEMRLHAVVLADGTQRPFERWSPGEGAPSAIVVEDSRGLLTITVAGTVEAQPPLDEAVRGDLLEVLEGVLARDPSTPR